jgi:hypothetical protein
MISFISYQPASPCTTRVLRAAGPGAALGVGALARAAVAGQALP